MKQDDSRRDVLRQAAKKYFDALVNGDFDSIPFAESVELRAPLAPGGSARPIVGRSAVREIWWTPLKGAVSAVDIQNYYFAEDGGEICARAFVSIGGTDVVLRVIDRFRVDAEGRIHEQENHFDPRDVTTPGWSAE